jgi:hypothetical protein
MASASVSVLAEAQCHCVYSQPYSATVPEPLRGSVLIAACSALKINDDKPSYLYVLLERLPDLNRPRIVTGAHSGGRSSASYAEPQSRNPTLRTAQ